MSTNPARRVLWFEGLESRRVLAAGVSLAEGVLTIEGTHKNDRIVVSVVGELGDQLSVVLNKSQHLFSLADVSELNINALGGNDRVVIADSVTLLAIVDGGNGNDWLKGGGGRNEMFGGAGNDHLAGGEGDDVLVGGAGQDKLLGFGGQDQLEGGAGNDALNGGEGDDLLIGDAGHDRIAGGLGNDEIWGGTGHDLINAGDGDDLVHGEAGNDIVHAGAGNDTVFGEAGHDLLYGGDGDDWLDGGYGKDKMLGGQGNDSLKGGLGNDHLDGGAGDNLLDGDEGKNKLKNGVESDLDQPQQPDPPEVVEYITYLQSEGGSSTQLVYTNTPLGDAFEEVLVVHVNDAHAYSSLEVWIDYNGVATLLGEVVVVNGSGVATFSTVPDQSHENAFPAGFNLLDGAAVSVGPELHGFLNLSQV
jgi:Ca2+-binding RTX toxin-like protein